MSNLKPSDILVKTRLVAGITPLNDNSNFPSHYADFGYGGLRSVTTITTRDAIPAARRDNGMLAYVISEDKYYKLLNGITNSDWVELAISSSSTVGLTEIEFSISDWTETNAPTGAIVIDLQHNLDQENITVDWFENNLDGAAFVPWESINLNTIRGCIPKGSFDGMSDTGNAFGGEVRIAGFVAPANASNVESIRLTFNAATSGTNPSWVETGMDTGIYSLTLDHGLATNSIEYDYYIDDIVPNLIRATTLSTTQIEIQVPLANVFAGSVFITKVT